MVFCISLPFSSATLATHGNNVHLFVLIRKLDGNGSSVERLCVGVGQDGLWEGNLNSGIAGTHFGESKSSADLKLAEG